MPPCPAPDRPCSVCSKNQPISRNNPCSAIVFYGLKQQELQKQEEQAISNDTEVVELQDTPDGLTMMGEDGNEISIDKEQNGNPVDVSTDITEDTVSESQTSDTVINDTESEDEIKSEEATLETLDNAYLDEVMKQQPEEEEPQDACRLPHDWRFPGR